MATFDLPFQRRKVATYGKAARSQSNTLWDFDASPEKPKLVGVTASDDTATRSSPSKESQRLGGGKLTRPSPRKVHDEAIFDVPLSDDDTPRKAKSPRPSAKRKLENAGRSTREGVSSRETTDTSKSDTESSRKRKRSVTAPIPAINNTGDVMEQIQAELRENYKGGSVDGMETSSMLKQRSLQANAESSAHATKKPRQKKPAVSLPKSKKPLVKGVSAPSMLHAMMSDPDSDPKSSPAVSSATPEPTVELDFLPSTPPMRAIDSPRSALGSGAVTPRQKDMWKKLITSSGPSGSPSELPISGLDLSSSRKLARLTQSTSESAKYDRRSRSRLVDLLKDAAPAMDYDEHNQDDEDDEDEEPTEFIEIPPSEPALDRMAPPALHRERSSQQSETYTKSSAKVTYAQQRSYLEERTEEDAFDMLAEEMGILPTANSSQGQQMSIDEEEDEDDSQRAQPRSVHDLRAAGTKRRLLQDLEALVNEVAGQGFDSLSAKRSALVELAMKLCDKEAVTSCLDHGLDYQVVENCSKTDETWFNFAAAAAVGLLITGGVSMDFLTRFRDSECFNRITSLLDYEGRDVKHMIKDRKANMSKIAQMSVLDLEAKIQQSSLWPPGKPTKVYPRLIASKTMELLVRRLRELGSQEILLDGATIGRLLACGDAGLQGYKSGKDGETDILLLEAVLSTLESSSLVPSSKAKKLGWTDSHLRVLASILTTILSAAEPLPGDVEILALRLTLNLTNNNPRACAPFANPAIAQPLLASITTRFGSLSSAADEEQHLSNLDRLILALGALINLAEWSDGARQAVIAGSEAALAGAVRLFIEARGRAADAESIQASQTNVAYGYLAVLLGNLCLSTGVRRAVQRYMPDGSLEPLVDAVGEFILFNQKVDTEAFEGEEGRDVFVQFTDRLKAVLERLREAS